jgi:endogenous inhibitor of DNA gyrase (YacG/DUF329 family)
MKTTKLLYIKQCANCGIDIEITNKHKNKKYCSIRCSKLGKNNPKWTGDSVSYNALHTWINTHLPKPLKCECCNEDKKLDAANISGEYKREFSDWKWLCRSCHMKDDNRISNLIRHEKILNDKSCNFCQKSFSPSNINTKFCSRICYFKEMNRVGKEQYNKSIKA